MKIIISESQDNKLRHIYRRINKIEEYLFELINDPTWLINQDFNKLNFSRFSYEIASIVAHQMAQELLRGKTGERYPAIETYSNEKLMDEVVTARNQIRLFIENNYAAQLRGAWERIQGIDKYGL